MLRWLAPRLPGRQIWVCYDWDADLLALAEREEPCAEDGSPVTVLARHRDVTRLEPGQCAGATLITTSALLDLLTADELDRLVATCSDAECPALLTLSVTGQVRLWPPDPLDAVLRDAFNAHQRRSTGMRQLLGPDAAGAAVRAFRRTGAQVTIRASTWRLGPASYALTAAWLTGWVAAACEQHPELRTKAQDYVRRRRDDLASGRLRVVVCHHDLLVEPATMRGVG
jgi:hypothetical protein